MYKQLIAFGLLSLLSVCKSMAQSAIWAKDAAKYIGQTKEVDGHLYKQDIRKVRSYPDSLIIISYMGELNDAAPDFIAVMKLNMKGSHNEGYYGRSFKAVSHALIKKMNSPELIGAYGKIVLLKGKPAIISTYEHVIILEPVD